MEAANSVVKVAITETYQLRSERDSHIYALCTGLFDIAKRAKLEVKSIFGACHIITIQIRKPIKFTKPRKLFWVSNKAQDGCAIS